MVQMNKMVRPIDMRVSVMEFTKAISLTAQYTQVGEQYRVPGMSV